MKKLDYKKEKPDTNNKFNIMKEEILV